jgi:iron complex transport system substrate-binding protein
VTTSRRSLQPGPRARARVLGSTLWILGSWLWVLLLGCGRGPDGAGAREVVDARGKAVRVPARPQRIVSILPSATELLFAAGAGGQIAGVTTWCLHPPEARAKPKVGALVVDGERLAALKPDLIVTTERMTRQATSDLEAAGYPVYSIDPTSFPSIAETLRRLGALTGHAEEAGRAADALMARVEAVRPAPGPTVYFEHSAEPLGTTGPESFVGDLLRRAGARNVFDGGFRLVDWESVLARDPEVILVSHDRRDLERRAGWAGLKAVKAGRVHYVDKMLYIYPTPRLAEGLEEAARLLRDAKGP